MLINGASGGVWTFAIQIAKTFLRPSHNALAAGSMDAGAKESCARITNVVPDEFVNTPQGSHKSQCRCTNPRRSAIFTAAVRSVTCSFEKIFLR